MIIMIRLLLIVVLLAPFELKAAGDTTIVFELKHHKAHLYYPREVASFYNQNGYKLAWIAPDTIKTHVWDAMLLLDCVRQYGLNHEDYHPELLLYPDLHKLIDQKGTHKEEVIYDILLTDAVIRFMNDLHYGKLNPVYTRIKIDNGVKFKVGQVLLIALQGSNFLGAINDVQPTSKLYIDLQDHMRLLIGQRSGDCYVVPPSLIRKMAINMERLRWINTTGQRVHITCVVREGMVINYKDSYHQDKELERALYGEDPLLKQKLDFKLSPEKL
jgi:murein L,D-transpeptidase YcbB/YkuD